MLVLEQFFDLFAQLLKTLFDFTCEFIEMLFLGVPKKKNGYNAEFVSAGTIMSSWNYGFCLTGRKSLTVKSSFQNALIIGGTGVGKSSVVLTPSLYKMRGSFICHDPSGELFAKSGGYLKQRGYEVKRLNFADPSVSAGYNPLARANTSSEIQKVASMLIDNALGKGKDPFWNTQASALLALLITILKTQEPQYQNLYNVRHLLNLLGGNPKAVDALFSKHASEMLFSEYKAFIAYDEKVVNGILATAKAALQIFTDESVAKVTSTDTIAMQDFRTKPVALFIQNSVADQKYYSVLTSILFEQWFSFILGRFAEKGEQNIFLLIDEASSLFLPTLPLAVANVRKHSCGAMILVQDFNQLIHHYGKYDADAIKSNCYAKMYFTGQGLETAKELEQTLGKFEYEEEETGKKVVRSLMTNDEIRIMKSNRALLICGNNPPIMAKLKPFYKRLTYRSYSSIPAPEIKSDAFAPVPVLGLTYSSAKTNGK